MMHPVRRSLWIRVLLLVVAFGNWPGRAAAAPMVELQCNDRVYVGRVATFQDHQLWLQEQNGQLHLLKKEEITGFKRLERAFTPCSTIEVRDQLRREFGSQVEVVGTGNYLVCGKRGIVERYADVFEEAHRAFTHYFSVRGILPQRPEFPLVAIVFSSRQEFSDYAKQDKVFAGGGMVGYYMRTTNRVAAFDQEHKVSQGMPVSRTGEYRFPLISSPVRSKDRRDLFADSQWDEGGKICASIEGNTKDTIIHEVTHQMAFNTGVHPRIGEIPRWCVEGLATVFESPGIRRRDPSGKVSGRINRERYSWFQTFRKARRPGKFLQNFLASDDPFFQQPLDAYSEAWALSFYLLETRPREYSAYLRLVSSREPWGNYGSKSRLEDFQRAFGNDLTLLEAAYLRHMQDVK